MVKVVMNTATEVIDAPFSRSAAARGNEIKEGICKTDPNNATTSIPKKPVCSPTILEIWSCGTKPKSRPMNITMIRTVGNILKNDFNAIINACLVFVLSLIKASIKQAMAKRFIKKIVILIISTIFSNYLII